MRKVLFGLLVAVCCITGMAPKAQANFTGSPHCDTGHNGPHCWCKIRVGCGGKILWQSGGICRYNDVVAGKEGHCGTQCAAAAAGAEGGVKANPAAACSGLPNGTHRVDAFSIVGAGASTGNRCDSDRFIGNLTCVAAVTQGASCTCPAGLTLSGNKCDKPNIAATAKPCPAGYWAEPKYGAAGPAVCVKQACPQGSMPPSPAVAAWQPVPGSNGTALPAYLTDDKNGTRHFIAAGYTCPAGYTLTGNQCDWPTSNATCTCPAGFTLTTGATSSSCTKAATGNW